MIKKVLVALDGSEHANHALNYALDLAEKYSATIVLLSVYKFPVSCYYAPPEAMRECLEAQKDQHGKVLSEALERVKKMKPDLKSCPHFVACSFHAFLYRISPVPCGVEYVEIVA